MEIKVVIKLRRILLSVLFLSVYALFGCQQQTLEKTEDLAPRPETDSPKDEKLLYVKQPELAGGPEQEVREPHPVSNDQLQKMYPNVLYLRGSEDQNKVALTFDDGPDMRFTPLILDVLDQHDVKATFFMMGSRAKEHEEIVRRAHEEGHVIGNHTYWHPNLPKEELDRLDWEVRETEKVIENIVGYKPRLFRSPYGALNEEMVETLENLGNTIIGWDVDSLDWKQMGDEVISDNVLSNVRPGSIILMHDGGDWTMNLMGTVNSLDRIITKLKEDQIEFVTVPELLDIPKQK